MRTRHTLTLQPTKEKRGSAGQRERENDGNPVVLRGNMHELAADEVQLWGDSARITKRFFFYGKIWPGDIYSKITFDGDAWDQVAPAQTFGFTRKHIEVILRKR